jgi:transcriptional regulator with XRE-family HTH domain
MPTRMDRPTEGVLVEMIVAERLREERLARRIFTTDVARSMGVSSSHLSRIELGSRGLRVSDAWMMAQAIGVDLRDLFP